MMCTYSNIMFQHSLLRAYSLAYGKASCGLVAQVVILLISSKAMTFVAKAMSWGGNYSN